MRQTPKNTSSLLRVRGRMTVWGEETLLVASASVGKFLFHSASTQMSALVPTRLLLPSLAFQRTRKDICLSPAKLSIVGPLRRKSPENSDELGKKTGIEAVIVAPSRVLGVHIVREVEKLLGPAEKRLVWQLVDGANSSRTARSWGNDPLLVQSQKIIPLEAATPRPVNVSNPIVHSSESLSSQDKAPALENQGIRALELHGDLGKLARSTALKKFKGGEVRVLE
ncbi:hypothetical protein SAY86_027993 [Trapa natans]|uniref:RNA helicase n=1 Tax=Trapa natans TaxID=22666 RepID=A0AAN7MC49_TRANT|nr:hypothetical protein SAY86_027993 [Trapa natans]